MNWQEFKNTLQQYPELELQFQYGGDKRVDASYHITEIKQATITSVDCGGVMNSWTEVIVQLYEPSVKNQLKPMKVKKALSIINIVENTLPLHPLAIVKIEFGNSTFDTRQMLPQSITTYGEDIVVDLGADTVQCKAIDRGGSCGPVDTAAKPKIELKNLAVNDESCCTPGGGCC